MSGTVSSAADRRALAARLEAEVGDDRRANAVLMRHVFSHYASEAALVFMPFEDHSILFDPRDDKIGMTLLAGRPWQRRFIDRAFATLEEAGRLKSDGVYIDVGANIGTTTLYALCSGRISRAVSYEPELRNAGIFVRNMALNGLSGRATLRTAALGAAPGHLPMAIDMKNLGAHTLDDARGHEAATRIDVAVTTLDHELADLAFVPEDVALIKIDVEGYELEVLAGMSHVLACGAPILLEAGGLLSDPARFARLLECLGPAYRFVRDVDRENDPPAAISEFVPSADQHELLVF